MSSNSATQSGAANGNNSGASPVEQLFPKSDSAGLDPQTVDDMIRMIKVSSPNVDISELPIIKAALEEHNHKNGNGNGTGSSNDHSNGVSTPQVNPQNYVRPHSQSQAAPTSFMAPPSSHIEHETPSIAVHEEPQTVPVRIMVQPKDSTGAYANAPNGNTHEVMELDATLSYVQLQDTLRRFLLKHSRGDSKARANLSSTVFTPDHQLSKIKCIWSNVNASGLMGDGASSWGGPIAALPSSDTFVTEENCAVILSAIMKRAGALDTLVLVTFVPDDN